MQKGFDKLKKQFEEDPIKVLFVAALVATASAKLIDSLANSRNSHAWATEVARRDRMSRK